MHDVHGIAETIGEYHTRQRANSAANEASEATSALLAARSKVRSIRKHLETALELLDEGDHEAIRREIQVAVDELKKMRVLCRFPEVS